MRNFEYNHITFLLHITFVRYRESPELGFGLKKSLNLHRIHPERDGMICAEKRGIGGVKKRRYEDDDKNLVPFKGM
jgi:hypothetical protein